MSCDSYEIMISRQVDGELEPQSWEMLKRHLDGCVGCSELYERVTALDRRVRVVTHRDVDPALSARVKERVAAIRAGRRGGWLVPAWRQVAIFATLTLVAVGIGNLAGRSLTEVVLDHRPPDRGIELLVPENPSFSDAMLAFAREENPR